MNDKAWKFSLLAVFLVLIGGQQGFYLLNLANCNDPNTPNSKECDQLLESYQQATDSYMQTILALMVGSGAMAAGAVAITTTRKPKDTPPDDNDLGNS